jgi:competence protein ComEA
MDWIKQHLSPLIGGSQPPNRKVVAVAITAAVAVAFALNFAVSENQVASTQKPATAQVEQDSFDEVELPELYIHVVGEVKKPGIYLLPIGSRLVDAIFAAGGFGQKADQGSVNLARVLTDGEQVVILTQGSAGDSISGSAGVGGMGLISLNRALASELEQLPGVGPALAGRMVDWRAANGGFKSKDDLQNVSGIGDKLFAAIEKLVTL